MLHPDPVIQKRFAWVVANCEQFIRDIEWWNKNRTDAPPMDCEAERAMLAIARKMEATTSLEEYTRLSKQLLEVAKRSVAEWDENGNLKIGAKS